MSERKGRIEDLRLVTGRGRFTDDVAEPGALHVAFLRSPHAAARIVAIDAAVAIAMDGVVAVLTGADLVADGIGPVQAPMKLEGPDGRTWEAVERPLLATGHARFVGEPVAMVVAETRAAAMDAAEMIEVEFDESDAVVDVDTALGEGAPRVHETRPGNVGYEWGRGDWDAVGDVIAASAHRVALRIPVSRVNAAAMEPRNALARQEGETLVLYASHQAPQNLKSLLVGAFGIEAGSLRVVAGDVGGTFGMKAGPMREEMLTLWAARRLGRAVRWRADRTDDFLSDEGGRDVVMEVELGLDAGGIFTGQRVRMLQNVGAYVTGRSLPPIMNFGGIAGVYRTPHIAGRVVGVMTHTVPIAPYRGAGRPEATLAIERAVDAAARQIGIDPVTLRRQNLIPPEAMPWRSPFIFDYDVGEFERVLDAGLERGDVAGFAARRADSEARGKLRGMGLALCIEVAGGPYTAPSTDYADVTLDADGTVTVLGGAFNAGQGLETAMIDVVADALGIGPDDFRYRQGDTDAVPRGKGMGGSSGMIVAGSAALDAVDKVLDQAKRFAADELEVAQDDLEYGAGRFRIVGTDRAVDLKTIAGVAAAKGTPLHGAGEFKPKSATFPNGCHICEVEVDPETGCVAVLSYRAIEDIGRVLNEQLAEGQIHGGVAQGLGQVFMEAMRFGGDGQVLSASYMDYAVPRADDLPVVDCGFAEVETELNPLKVKGVGEAGSVGGLAAGMNAVCDALASAGVTDFAMPASPGRIWEALRAAR
ncbi:xanthine dehydrogenase family protein molybdopterin-binding subunit [Acuticoccus sp. M5D2P5]|uniref:xanthine dehydrogenase family protein molybdopterin-binding subunit n=1 Tax=Acuticoccus kalidii TaxID=2910977 RepID=UPI001F491651|nr:xanthine dehydrogenase family protein molybdopterin-binding subunit [Acuticoccus kalidii]MCF3932452.1 xanthine dehydrogenase family protein molybdopterin-binding subunit [Acuticoccus kalidii]